ncbi:MAG: superoxide dismutase family protein [Erythrobacter sp.]
MTHNSVLKCALAACALSSCSTGETSEGHENEKSATEQQMVAFASVLDPEGVQIGEAKFLQLGEQLSLNLTLENAGQGEHGFHIHAVGQCEAPDFASAGGHLNPFDRTHGSLSDGGAHLGDLPNIGPSDEPVLNVEVAIEGMASELLSEILDDDGSAIMVHAGPDDYISDPAGAAGPRIACGIIDRVTPEN